MTPRGERSPEHGALEILVDRDRKVAASYEVMSTPSAVLVDPEGTIGAPLAIGDDAIGYLIDWAIK